MEELPDCDYIESCLEEISLEGLDGITLSALWTRLKDRPNFVMVLDAASKQFLWEVCILQPDVDAYILPEPRPPLVIFNRFANVDPETGLIVEPKETPLDIYPFCVIQEPNVFGSCGTYHTRTLVTSSVRSIDDLGVITPQMSLTEVEKKWGDRLVLVASQERRRRTLLGPETDPRLQLTPIQYAMLERIGRARYLGEVTQGKNSLNGLHASAKTLFYHRKLLLQKGVITKQLHYQKSCNGQLRNGMLLHLSRFYVERKSKIFLMLQEMCRYLHSRPNQTDSVDAVKKYMGIKHRILKQTLRKSLTKLANIRVVAVRELYPDASHAQCYFGNGKERTVRILQLRENVDPDNLEKILYDEEGDDDESGSGKKASGSKKSKGDDDGDDDDDDDDDNDANAMMDGQKNGTRKQRDPLLKYGIPNPCHQIIDRPMLHQAYKLFEQLGPNGESQRKFGMLLGVPRLEGRAICRNLKRLGVVSIIMKDAGRQRVTHYTARRFTGASAQHRELYEECQKMLQITMGSGDLSSVKDPPEESASNSGISNSSVPSVTVEQCTTEVGDNSGVKHGPGTLMGDVQKMFNPEEGGLAVTSKILKRVNLILQAVRHAKVIENHFNLQKMIIREEAKDGDDHKVDRKSIFRLVKRLAKEGYVKYIQTILRHGDKEKKIHMICDPSLSTDDPLIQSAVEQAKFKYFAITSEASKNMAREHMKEMAQRKKEGAMDNQVWQSVLELRNLYEKDNNQTPLQFNPYIGRMHGYEPKFIRIKIFHEYLYYLVYGYEGQSDVSVPEEVKRLDAASRIPFPKVYHPQVSWKMFISPLPAHVGWRKGWCLFSDALLRMPLSILVKLVNYNFKIEGIEEYLDNPIKRNLPISRLPKHLRNYLLFARKYIFATHEIAVKMAYMGLLSFSQKELKDKDQVFMFIHLAARVVDTTTSRRGYHRTSEEDYPVRHYRFSTTDDLNNYWLDLETVCLNTPLGCYNQEQGKELTFETLCKKPAMVEAVASKAENEVVDEGVIPGDSRGAGGLDSMLYAHLKRNWTWVGLPNCSTTKRNVGAARQRSASKTKGTAVGMPGSKESSAASKGKSSGAQYPSAFIRLLQDKGNQIQNPPNTKKRLTRLAINTRLQALHSDVFKVPSLSSTPEQSIPQTKPSLVTSDESGRRKPKPPVQVRTIQRKKRPRKPYYDEADKDALKRVAKQRVSWSSKEDSLLLLCMVASNLLHPNCKGLVVPFTVVRDYLHRTLEVMRNKTSRACQRRLRYMMRNPATTFNVSVFVGESRQDKEIAEYCDLPHIPKKAEDEWKQRFDELMEKLLVKFRVSSTSMVDTPAFTLPNTLEEFMNKFDVTVAKELLELNANRSDVKNIVDIHFSVVYTLILCSVAVVNEGPHWSYYLYQIYRQYPETLLHSALGKLRSSLVLCRKKDSSTKTKKRMLLVTMPYQLSSRYEYLFTSRFRNHIFTEGYELLEKLFQDYDNDGPGVPIVADHEGGYAAAIVSLLAAEKLMFDLTVPDDVIILNVEEANLNRHMQTFNEKRARSQLRAVEGSVSRLNEKLQLTKQGMKKNDVSAMLSRENTTDGSHHHYHDKRNSDRNDGCSWSPVPPRKKRKLSPEDSSFSGAELEKHELLTPGSVSGKRRSAHKHRQGKDNDAENEETLQELVQVESGTSKIQFQPLTRSSRFALYMLRQELTESPIDTSQHSPDYLAIRQCSVQCKLSPKAMSPFSRYNYPLSESYVQRILSRLTMRLPSESVTLTDAIGYYSTLNFSEDAVEEMGNIYGYVLVRRELGVKKSDLQTWFTEHRRNPVLSLVRHLELMTECYLIVKVGVVHVRYVAQAHVKPWLIDSEKIPKPRNNNQLGGGGVLDFAVNSQCFRDLGKYVCRPWNKPDGTINMSTVKHILLGIMSHLMTYPGSTFQSLCKKYSSVLNPVHVMELMNILEEAECVHRIVIKAPLTPTLFSLPAAATKVETDYTEGDDDDDDRNIICYDPAIEGNFKLMRLLNAKYN